MSVTGREDEGEGESQALPRRFYFDIKSDRKPLKIVHSEHRDRLEGTQAMVDWEISSLQRCPDW